MGLKFAEGCTRLWPSVWTVAAMALGLTLLGLALRTLPLGPASAGWKEVGTVGTSLQGIRQFREPAHLSRLHCILLMVAGITGLNLRAPH